MPSRDQPWLAAAASLALVGAASWYAMLARQQAADAFGRQQSADARVLAMQDRLTQLEARMTVMSAPDVQKISLQAQPDAPRTNY